MKIQKYLLWGMAIVGTAAVGMYLYNRYKNPAVTKSPAPSTKGMNVPTGTAAPDMKPAV